MRSGGTRLASYSVPLKSDDDQKVTPNDQIQRALYVFMTENGRSL